MRFAIFANPQSAEALLNADKLQQMLSDHGQMVCPAAESENADVIATFGGDGTVLRAVKRFGELHKPFWAINCGHLGYLSDCLPKQMEAGLHTILNGKERLEYRCLIGGTISVSRKLTALNEIIFHRGGCAHGLQVQVRVNGSLVLRYRGDGLIVCTPSGSTAYNLSAGGPLLMPEMDLVSLTPICGQAFSAVPIVVSAHDTIEVAWYMSGGSQTEERPYLMADGLEKITLENNGSAVFSGPAKRIALIKTHETNFCDRLQARMHWND